MHRVNMEYIPITSGFGCRENPLLAFAGYTVPICSPPRKNFFTPAALATQLVSASVALAASPLTTARPTILAGLSATIQSRDEFE